MEQAKNPPWAPELLASLTEEQRERLARLEDQLARQGGEQMDWLRIQLALLVIGGGSALLKPRPLNGTEQMLLMQLALFHGLEGSATTRSLAHRMNLGIRAIQDALKRLEEMGLIARHASKSEAHFTYDLSNGLNRLHKAIRGSTPPTFVW